MSFPIEYSCLDSGDKTAISKELLITPTLGLTPFEEARMAASKYAQKPPDPFPFYYIRAEAEEIRLPLTWFVSRFGEGVDLSSKRHAPITADPRLVMRDHQVPVIEEAHAMLLKSNVVSIQVPPGFGKTMMSITLAARLGLKFAVLTPRTTLSKQWIDSISAVIDVKIYELPQAAKRTPKTIAAVAAAEALVCLETRSATAATPEELADVGTLIIDEAHMCCTEKWVKSILAYSPKYIIALTATLERKDGAHEMIHHLVGTTNVITRPPVRNYTVYKVQTNALVPESISPATDRLDYSKLISDLSQNPEYNAAIVNIVLAHPERKFIILFKLADHAAKISETLEENGVTSATMTRSKKSYKDCRALCGTFGKISTGFDAKMFSTEFDGINPDAVIFANTVKTWQSFEQSAGRGKRADDGILPAVFWIMSLNKITQTHLSGIKKYITSTNGSIESYIPPGPHKQPSLD